ncbi:MAG: YIP1 family protein, partial [Anaerolineae bacterium]|nr:YIP1 family protein [Anaerolineae bacterium]
MDTVNTQAIHEQAWAKHEPSVASVEKSAGLLRVLTGMIFKPRTTLARLIHAYCAWLPAVLMVVVVILTTYAGSHADSYYFYQDQLEFYAQSPENARFAPTQPTFVPLMTILIRIGERLAVLFGSWALWAVALYLMCIFTGQRNATFGAMVKLTLWSWMPYIVQGLLQSAYMFLTHDPIFNPGLSGLVLDNTPPAMGLYDYMMIPRQTRLWGTVLSYVDVYLFWHIALVL